MKTKIETKTMKLFLLTSTFKEAIASGYFRDILFTNGLKSIPTQGSNSYTCKSVTQAKDVKCDKVITHNNGDFTCRYCGQYYITFTNN